MHLAYSEKDQLQNLDPVGIVARQWLPRFCLQRSIRLFTKNLFSLNKSNCHVISKDQPIFEAHLKLVGHLIWASWYQGRASKPWRYRDKELDWLLSAEHVENIIFDGMSLNQIDVGFSAFARRSELVRRPFEIWLQTIERWRSKGVVCHAKGETKANGRSRDHFHYIMVEKLAHIPSRIKL